MFRKTEKKRLPTALGIAVGALAVVGVVAIKSKGTEIISSAKKKIDKMFKKKTDLSEIMNDMECEF